MALIFSLAVGLMFGVGQWITSLTWQRVVVGALFIVVTFAVSTALVSFVVVKLPATYFHPSHNRDFWTDRHHAVRWTGFVIKNLAGLVLVLLGIAMSLPGVPGPGVLTILFGIMLLDFPGKRRLENKLVSRPKVFGAINRLRQRFGKPPMVL